MTSMPATLEDFFEAFPELGEANLQLTSIPHTQMWRDQVRRFAIVKLWGQIFTGHYVISPNDVSTNVWGGNF